MNEKSRVFFYGIIGAYLVYLSYDLFKNRGTDAGANSPLLVCICVLFAVAGGLLLGLTFYKLKKVYQEGEQANKEAQERKPEEKDGKKGRALPESEESDKRAEEMQEYEAAEGKKQDNESEE